jgi:hypothetical protein
VARNLAFDDVYGIVEELDPSLVNVEGRWKP